MKFPTETVNLSRLAIVINDKCNEYFYHFPVMLAPNGKMTFRRLKSNKYFVLSFILKPCLIVFCVSTVFICPTNMRTLLTLLSLIEFVVGAMSLLGDIAGYFVSYNLVEAGNWAFSQDEILKSDSKSGD